MGHESGAAVKVEADVAVPGHDLRSTWPRACDARALKEARRRRLTGALSKFQYTRNQAVRKLAADVFRKLDIIADSAGCGGGGGGAPSRQLEGALPHGLFTWSWAKFEERRALPGTIWLNVLEKEIPAVCLQIRKARQDLRELQKYLAPIFEGLADADDENDSSTFDVAKFEAKVLRPIRDAYDVVNVHKRLMEVLDANRRQATDLAAVAHLLQASRQGDDTLKWRRAALEQHVVDRDAIDPIEVRYSANYLRDKCNQAAERAESVEGGLKEDMRSIRHHIVAEEASSYASKLLYVRQIEQFKRELSSFSELYDADCRAVDDKISYKRISMEKMKEQEQFMREEIVRFHRAIQRVRDEEIAEQEAEERRKQEELEALAAEAAQAAKNAKKKRPGKPKKK